MPHLLMSLRFPRACAMSAPDIVQQVPQAENGDYLVEGSSQCQAAILRRVVVIDVEITFAPLAASRRFSLRIFPALLEKRRLRHVDVDAAMLGHSTEHVIQESNASIDVVLAKTI